MGKSFWKGYGSSLKDMVRLSNGVSRIYKKSSRILSPVVGISVGLHLGSSWKDRCFREEWVGYKLGEFVTTKGKALLNKADKNKKVKKTKQWAKKRL